MEPRTLHRVMENRAPLLLVQPGQQSSNVWMRGYPVRSAWMEVIGLVKRWNCLRTKRRRSFFTAGRTVLQQGIPSLRTSSNGTIDTSSSSQAASSAAPRRLRCGGRWHAHSPYLFPVPETLRCGLVAPAKPIGPDGRIFAVPKPLQGTCGRGHEPAPSSLHRRYPEIPLDRTLLIVDEDGSRAFMAQAISPGRASRAFAALRAAKRPGMPT
jgi:hypothetical protein